MTIQLNGDATPMLTPAALDFIGDLVRVFRSRFSSTLDDQSAAFLDDCPDDADGYAVNAADLTRLITVMTAGAPHIIADFEDCTPATWEDILRGQDNLRSLTRFNIDYQDHTGNWHALTPDATPPLMVRPRSLMRTESNITVDGEPIPAGLFDFGLYVYYNAAELVIRGLDVAFYVKGTGNDEKRIWQQIAGESSAALGLPQDRIIVH